MNTSINECRMAGKEMYVGKETLDFHLWTHMDEGSPGYPSLMEPRYLFARFFFFFLVTQYNIRINLEFILDVDNIGIAHQSHGYRPAPTILFYFHLQLPESLTKHQISKLPH